MSITSPGRDNPVPPKRSFNAQRVLYVLRGCFLRDHAWVSWLAPPGAPCTDHPDEQAFRLMRCRRCGAEHSD